MKNPKIKPNTTRNCALNSTVNVLSDGLAQAAKVTNIGEPRVGDDGKAWCMITAKTSDGKPVYVAALHEEAARPFAAPVPPHAHTTTSPRRSVCRTGRRCPSRRATTRSRTCASASAPTSADRTAWP